MIIRTQPLSDSAHRSPISPLICPEAQVTEVYELPLNIRTSCPSPKCTPRSIGDCQVSMTVTPDWLSGNYCVNVWHSPSTVDILFPQHCILCLCTRKRAAIVSSYVTLQFAIRALHNVAPPTHSDRLAWHCSPLLVSKKDKNRDKNTRKREGSCGNIALCLFVCLFRNCSDYAGDNDFYFSFILQVNVRDARGRNKNIYTA